MNSQSSPESKINRGHSGVSTFACPSALGGEENIANDESPHKCHSVNNYNMRTFFNKEYGHVHKLLKFYNK
jgi:hypothetical protein